MEAILARRLAEAAAPSVYQTGPTRGRSRSLSPPPQQKRLRRVSPSPSPQMGGMGGMQGRRGSPPPHWRPPSPNAMRARRMSPSPPRGRMGRRSPGPPLMGRRRPSPPSPPSLRRRSPLPVQPRVYRRSSPMRNGNDGCSPPRDMSLSRSPLRRRSSLARSISPGAQRGPLRSVGPPGAGGPGGRSMSPSQALPIASRTAHLRNESASPLPPPKPLLPAVPEPEVRGPHCILAGVPVSGSMMLDVEHLSLNRAEVRQRGASSSLSPHHSRGLACTS